MKFFLIQTRGFDDSKIEVILSKDEDEKRAEMKKIYRKFTDQIIETLRLNGAP